MKVYIHYSYTNCSFLYQNTQMESRWGKNTIKTILGRHLDALKPPEKRQKKTAKNNTIKSILILRSRILCE